MGQRYKGTILFFLGILLLLGLGTAVAAAYFLAQPTYTILDDDRPPLTVSGDFANVAAVLTAGGVMLRAEDRVLPAPDTPADPKTAIRIVRARAVIIRTESAPPQTVWTQQETLGALLREKDFAVQPGEQLVADGKAVPFGDLDRQPLPAEVEIGRFTTVTIIDDGQQRTLRSSGQTVGDVLDEAGLTLYAADGVTPPLGSWVQPEMVITVARSVPVTIQVDGRLLQRRSHHDTVLDVLSEAGISLVGHDYTVPPLDATVAPNQTIQVIRVTEDFRLEDTPIPYQTVWQASDQLDIDTRAVISTGLPGIQRQRIRIRYENGVPVSETVDGEWVARQPVNEVIGYGTKITVRTIATPQGSREYWRVVRMRVTSYTAASSGKPPDHPAYGITASGRPAGTGIVAIDRNVVPWRSSVYVPGYGVGFAGDTGGGVRGRWIDLGYDEDEYQSWSGYVDVYYLTPVPPADDINFILPSALP